MKKVLSMVLVWVMVLTLIPLGVVTASAETLSGTTGDCTWTLVDGVLTISGNGAMADYSYSNKAPWDNSYSPIKEIIIEEGVTHIGSKSFWGAKKITIPKSVASIGESAYVMGKVYYAGTLDDWKILKTEHGETNRSLFTTVWHYTNNENLVSSGTDSCYWYFDGTTLTAGGTYMYSYDPMEEWDDRNWSEYDIQHVVILEGVINIGDYAFENQKNLKSVEIADSVVTIGNSAFYGCSGLKTIVLGENVKKIEEDAFCGCTNLKNVFLNKGIEEIEWYALASSTTDIYYPGSKEEADNIKIDRSLLNDNLTWHYNESWLIQEENGDYQYYLNGEKYTDTALVRDGSQWFYVENGVWSNSVETLVKYKNKWFYIKEGKWDSTINTLFKYKGKWFGVVNGKWNSSINTLIKYKDKWFYVENGKWDSSIETLTKYNGKWFYIKNGKWDSSVTKFFKYQGKTFYIKNGKWDSSITSLIKYNGKMRYVKNGKWNKSKAIVRYKPKYVEIIDGVYIASSELKGYKGERYYVNNGYVQSNFSGRVKYNGKTYKIKNGKVV